MQPPPEFQIGDKVFVPTPRSALFRPRSGGEDRVRGVVVGREEIIHQRGGVAEWRYQVKLSWDEPWVEISQADLLRWNPRES